MPPKKVVVKKVVEKASGKKPGTEATVKTRKTAGTGSGAGTAGESSGSAQPEAGSSAGLQQSGVSTQASGAVNTAESIQAPTEQSQVVFLEVSDYNKPFPKHALELGRALHAAGFSRSKELTKVGRFRYRVELMDAGDRAGLSRIDLSPLNLKLFTPTVKNQMICFIRGVPLDFSEDEIREIQCEVPVIKVERMKRRGDGESLVDTPNLKVTVQGKTVPRMVRIFGVSFRAEQYIFPVKQCGTCWRFGHSTKACFGNPRCRTCGRVHETGTECNDRVRCINCRGGHEASDRSCPERKRRAAIFRTMATKNVEYAEAEKEHPKASNSFALLQEEDGTGEGDFGDSYAKIAAQRRVARRDRTASSSSNDGKENNQRGKSRTLGERRPSTDRHFEGNTYRATDFEAFMAQMRVLFKNHLQSFGWLGPLKQLRDKLVDRLKQDRSEIETDQILIGVCTDLTNIVERAEQGSIPNRITLDNENGQ